ncbi:MAG: succinyl-diaminopimelate desuccinylase [Proteobacteria bacterium]|nr:succinyl-diaminopimelate desuccinylase [Pseudomonadota bacterium]
MDKILKEVLQLATDLINCQSVTPDDAGCQALLIEELTGMGFAIERLASGPVSNFWARKGTAGPLLVFSGHTDVVPPGPIEKWHSAPFQASVREGNLYGRGASDMKGALAAMVIACRYFLNENPQFSGSIGFMITSDEEGDAKDGTIKIVQHFLKNDIKPDWCLVGEASSQLELGDGIKVGRRGSLHGFLQVIGKQGHIAYPHLAENPIHRSFKALDDLTHVTWDNGNEFFTPTTFQIYNIQADTGASNIIPGTLTARFNFRYSTASSADQLKQKVHKILDDHDLKYKIEWNLTGEPFFSPPKRLAAACTRAVQNVCQREPDANTTGGTSDGRFIATLGCEIVELGPPSKTIHQINEHIRLNDLTNLVMIYKNVLEQLFRD